MNSLHESIPVKVKTETTFDSSVYSFVQADLLALEEQLPKRVVAGEIDNLTHVFSCTADLQINCVLHFNNHFDRSRMEHAVKLTFYTDPVLGSRYVVDEDHSLVTTDCAIIY